VSESDIPDFYQTMFILSCHYSLNDKGIINVLGGHFNFLCFKYKFIERMIHVFDVHVFVGKI